MSNLCVVEIDLDEFPCPTCHGAGWFGLNSHATPRGIYIDGQIACTTCDQTGIDSRLLGKIKDASKKPSQVANLRKYLAGTPSCMFGKTPGPLYVSMEVYDETA